MNGMLALPAPARPSIARRLSDLLYTRRGLWLLALLAPPLLWFGVIYLGSLFALLANAFFGLDDFSGRVVREFTLKNFVELMEPANLDVVRRSVVMAVMVTLAASRSLSHSPTTWRATPPARRRQRCTSR
jgi:putative spermidine/putrescine transport system permease protein